MTVHKIARAGLLAMLLAAPEAGRAACQPPVTLDVSGQQATVPIAVARGGSATAVFDTGAMAAWADPGAAATLGLVNEGPVLPPHDRMAGPGSYRSTLRGLRLGGVAVGDVAVSVMPSMFPGVVAVLTPQAFAGRLVEVDLGAARIRICDRRAALGALGPGTPYSPGPFSLPVLPVTVGGTSFIAHIDTGSPMGLTLPTRMAGQFTLTAPMVRIGSARGHAGVSDIYSAHISGTVRVGPLTLVDPEVRFTDVVPMPNVGSALLRQLIVTIDPDGHQSWARPAAAHGPG